MATLEEIEEAAREEGLDEVTQIDPVAAATWVEDLRERGLITDSKGVDLEPELRNLHLIAQVSSRLRNQATEKLYFYSTLIGVLAQQNGGQISMPLATVMGLPLGFLVESSDRDSITIRYILQKNTREGLPS